MGSHTLYSVSLPKRRAGSFGTVAHPHTHRVREMHAHSNTIRNNIYKYIQMRDSKESRLANERENKPEAEDECGGKKEKANAKELLFWCEYPSFLCWLMIMSPTLFLYLFAYSIKIVTLFIYTHTHSHTLTALVVSQKACCSRSM